jgi:hypothetical protein
VNGFGHFIDPLGTGFLLPFGNAFRLRGGV